MNYILRNLKSSDIYEKIVNNKTGSINISGLVCACKGALLSTLNADKKVPILLITYNEIEANELIKNLKNFTDKVYFFPKREIAIYDYDAESNEIETKRIEILKKIYNNDVNVVVTTIECLMQNMISKDALFENIIKIKSGETISQKVIEEKLVLMGYSSKSLVENFGEFSIRGDIIDIGTSEKEGTRIELWGDDVDSIRNFKYSSQRSTDNFKETEIFPANEKILETNVKNVADRINEMAKTSFHGFSETSLNMKAYLEAVTKIRNDDISKDVDEILECNFKNKIDKYFNEFYTNQSNFVDYCENFVIAIDEESKIEQRIDGIKKDNTNLIKELIEKEKNVPESLISTLDFDLEQILENLKNPNEKQSNIEKENSKVQKNLQLEVIENEKLKNSEIKNQNNEIEKLEKKENYKPLILKLQEDDAKVNNFRTREIHILNDDVKVIADTANKAQKNNKKVIVLVSSDEEASKILKLLNNATKTDDLDNVILKNGSVIVAKGNLSTGFEYADGNLIVISTEDIESPARKRHTTKMHSSFSTGEKIVFADLKVNDLVVHKNYGIGIFTGIKTITTDGATKDYIGIKYRDGDALYVPTNNLDNVRKYIGSEDGIQLNKLGTKEWRDTKAKVKGNLKAVAKDLIELYAKREKAKGFAFSKDTPWQKEFEDDFLYQETDDQLRCIAEVKADMEKEKPMDRLLCGDVGYGKTEVAMRAAFKAVMDSKQVCYLAPTTILANQQYQEFKKRMANFPVKIELLNRFRTSKEQKEIIEKMKKGEIDIIIGTHRLLSKDVEFKDLGLLIIDEEHRFGVKAKEKIKKYKESVDVLTMTATPIPRTLQMSIVGIRDMSVIYEPPQDRKPVQTYVLEYDQEVIKEAITKELERGGQVFYIYNNVQNISTKAIEIAELVPEAKVDFAHGQMSGSQIETIMQDFVDKKSNVLVCTTILESGIDIPNANTIIVENADRFGLAQLYQIRGRVGRSNRQAYAYITYRKDKIMSEDATQRLKAIKEFTEFGSGFKIATRDLQIRGAGSLFGEIQSGHLEQVGYDMYNRLLNEVVKETKGEKVEEEEDITIDIKLSAYIPENYIEDESQKIEIYQDIANCEDNKAVNDVVDEIIDRYGEMPKEVKNLIEIAKIKILCKDANVIKLKEKNGNIEITFNEKGTKMLTNTAKNEKMLMEILAEKYKNSIRFINAEKPYVVFYLKPNENKVDKITEFLKFVKTQEKEDDKLELQ